MSNNNLLIATRDALASRLKGATLHAIATLKATPEDKLDYRPTETSKSIKELAQHIVLGNNFCLQPLGLTDAGNTEATGVSELVTELQKTGGALPDYIDRADEETLLKTVEFFGQTIPMIQFLMIAEWHISRHSGQIDYIQTTWDDQEDRF